jgi:hypothetical protein
MSTDFFKRSRFNNKKVTRRGRTYDSKAEASYADTLLSMARVGKIKEVREQVRYPLPNMDGEMRMAYIADFVVINNSGEEFIIDVKGLLTPEMKVKLSYFQYYYKKKVHLVFTTGAHAYRTEFLL